MAKKILPIRKPDIANYMHHVAIQVPILDHRYYYDWMYSNYIQLEVRTPEKNEHFSANFFLEMPCEGMASICPIEEFYSQTTKEIVQKDAIQDTINKLNNGFYLYNFLDDYYVPTRASHQKRHFIHDSIIYGYDKEKSLFYLYGYNKTLVKSEISWRDFEKAITTVNDLKVHGMYRALNDTKYEIDIKGIVEMLQNYLSSSDMSEKRCEYGKVALKGQKYKYGLAVYDVYLDYLNYVLERNCYCDLRWITLFEEHAKCMYGRIKYLQKRKIIDNNESLIKSAWEITKILEIIKAIELKYQITGNGQEIIKARGDFEKVATGMASISMCFLKALDK